MQTSVRNAVGLAALGLLIVTARPATAATPERSLLGVRIWAPASAVLSRFHQPTRIEGAGESGGGMPATMSMGYPATSGYPGAGLPGLPGVPGMPSGPGSQMSEGGSSATAMLQAYQRTMQSMTGSPGGPPPGYGGPPGMMGGAPAGPYGEMGGPGDKETQWIYQLRNGNQITFLLNSDNRVIQIEVLGYSGAVTSRGVRLGDSLGKVFRVYGTTSDVTNEGSVMTLRYVKSHHCAFQLYNDGKGYKVVGIIVAATEGR